ncbi:MAG: DUF1552 domain-containing protein [Lentisphaerales bacterium]|nr:DUF1552 domain-containing protein [Lentisphaerales bacterium]
MNGFTEYRKDYLWLGPGPLSIFLKNWKTGSQKMISTRRTFLTALASSLALPTMASLGNNSKSPLRLICIGTDLGMHPDSFIPKSTASSFELSPLLKPLKKHKEDLSFINGFNHVGMKGSHGGAHAWLSGVTKDKASSFQEGNITVDQKLVEELGYKTRYPSLEIGVGGQMSWTRNAVPLPTIDSPKLIFQKMFLKDDLNAKKQHKKLLAENRSILDEHLESFRKLKPKLDKTDSEHFEQYHTSVRELEKKIVQQQRWFDVPKPKTRYKLPSVSKAINELMPVLYDLIHLAVQTDSSRFITFSLGQTIRINELPGITKGYHDLSHHGKNPEKLKQLLSIENFFMEELAAFVEKMKQTKQTDGQSLFSSTQIIFGSGLGNASSHSSKNLPQVVMGGNILGGKFIQAKGQRPLCNLYTTLLQSHGLEIDKFGTSDGNINELVEG